MVIVKKNSPMYQLEAVVFLKQVEDIFVRKLEQINVRLDYLESELQEMKKETKDSLDEIDAGISAIEEQIEEGVIKEAETNGYVRGIEHAQAIIDKNFKK